MHARYRAGLFSALLAAWSSGAAAATLPAADTTSPAPCASSVADPNDLPAAFAYDLESPDILRFVRVLAAVPEREQKRVFEAAIAAANDKSEQAIQAAVDVPCPSSDATYGTFRATYVVVNDWTLRDLKDANRFRTFDAVLATAVAALSLGERLTPEQRLTATRPFAGFDLQAPPLPVPRASGECTNAHARTLVLARPTYAPNAVYARTTGKVNVIVRLSDTGDVRSAKILRDTLGNAIGGDELRRQSIFAAATTSYAPEIRDCVPTGGFYIFQSEFTAR